MSSMPMVASARTIVVGFSGLDAVWDPGVWTFGPRADELTPGGASNRTETAVGLSDLAGDDEGELIQQALRVLHDAGHGARLGALMVDVPDLEAQVGGQPGGQRHLVRRGRVVPAEQGQHRLAERAVRVLGAQVVALDRAGDGEGLVLDHVEGAVLVLEGGDVGGQLRAG